MDPIDKLRVRRAVELVGLGPVLQRMQTITTQPMGGTPAALAKAGAAAAANVDTSTEAAFLSALTSTVNSLNAQVQQLVQQGLLLAQPLTQIQTWIASTMGLIGKRQQTIAQAAAAAAATPAPTASLATILGLSRIRRASELLGATKVLKKLHKSATTSAAGPSEADTLTILTGFLVMLGNRVQQYAAKKSISADALSAIQAWIKSANSAIASRQKVLAASAATVATAAPAASAATSQ